MDDILEDMKGGDLRSIGRVDQVIAKILANPSLFHKLFEGMQSNDPIIRMRSADAAEKITADHPEYLTPHKHMLLEEISSSEQKEVRWHVAQMLPRLELTDSERMNAVEILIKYTEDKSRIVKTFSMQALADLASRDIKLRSRVMELLEGLTEVGSPAVRSRGKKLLEWLYNEQHDQTI